MSRDEIESDLCTFLHGNIPSYEHLEALLLLHRERQERWTLESVAAKLDISTGASRAVLDHLKRCNLLGVQAEGKALAYAYGPSSPALGGLVDRLARAYHDNPLGVVKLMSENAVERVRTAALRTFSDAFLVGKKRDG